MNHLWVGTHNFPLRHKKMILVCVELSHHSNQNHNRPLVLMALMALMVSMAFVVFQAFFFQFDYVMVFLYGEGIKVLFDA